MEHYTENIEEVALWLEETHWQTVGHRLLWISGRGIYTQLLNLRATEPATPLSCIQVVVKGAGKKIHEVLLDADNVGVRDIAQNYLQECQLMSDLRHPNITLFLGCLLYTSPSPRDATLSRMPSSA